MGSLDFCLVWEEPVRLAANASGSGLKALLQGLWDLVLSSGRMTPPAAVSTSVMNCSPTNTVPATASDTALQADTVVSYITCYKA